MRTSATAAAIFFEAESFRHRDLSTHAAAFDVAIVHRLGEHWRDDEVTAIARFDLIIDLERVGGRAYEKHGAVFAHIDVIDARCRARPGVDRRIDDFETAWQRSEERRVGKEG